jgi:hypothetical protein
MGKFGIIQRHQATAIAAHILNQTTARTSKDFSFYFEICVGEEI